MTKEEIVEAINEAFEQRSRIDAETHMKHHNYVAQQIEIKESNSRLWTKVKEQVIGWGAISAIGFFGYHLVDLLRTSLTTSLTKLVK